jgi:LysM repeat protein
MLKSFKLVVTLNLLICYSIMAFSQEGGQLRDVILDGKPAKLNVVTGKITLVNSKDKTVDTGNDVLIKSSDTTVSDSLITQLGPVYHTVKENETLLDIANKYQTTLSVLKDANNLETTLVDVGQRLKVRNFESLEDEKVNDSLTTKLIQVDSYIHIVEKDDTLYSLAKKYGLTVDKLKSFNGLTSNLIKVGQELRISNLGSSYKSSNQSVWIVSKGDTLYSIAKKNKLSVEELKSLNGLTDSLILVGQTLKLK